MEDIIPCPVKDQEVFQRVWQRVMEGRDQAGSPIQPGSPMGDGDLPCACLEALMRQNSADPLPEHTNGGGTPGAEQAPPMEPNMAAEPGPVPDAPAPESPSPGSPPAECLPPAGVLHRGSDLPQFWEAPQDIDDRTAQMRRHVMDALEGWQFYRHLSKRARGTCARTLNAMAGEQHRQARRLSAAYFLLTGLRYWPSELLGAPAIPSYWGALRTRHQAEQRLENAFRLAADDWDDPEVLALYNTLADGCQQRAQQLRSLLEQDIS